MRRRDAAIAIPVLVVAFIATACGSSSSGGNSPGTTPSSSSSPSSGLKAEDINPQPVSALEQGGTLVWSLDQYSTQWNYNQVNGPESSTANVLGALLPEPTLADAQANLSFDPDYWTSAKLTSSSPETIEYKLNPQAKWSDGTPITEADFAAEWKALNGSNKAFQVASTTGYDQIQSIKEGPGGQFDVIVTFDPSKPFADWQSLFNPLYPAHYDSTPALFNKGYLNKIPVTAGPFKLQSLNSSAQTVTVVPDPNWWGTKPMLGKIVFKAEESTAANQAYDNGEIDYDYDVAVDAPDYKQVKAAQDGHVTLAAGPDYRQFTLNGTHGVMKDVKVRQAIAEGTDRTALINSDLKGIPWPAVPMDNHFFVNSQAGYQDNAGAIGVYSVANAKALLTGDGYTMSGGYFTKGGQPLSIGFTIPAGIASSKNEGELFQAMMQAVGIKVKIITVPVNAFFDKYIIPGNFDVTPFSWLGNPFISSGASIYLSPKNGGGQNFSGDANPAADALITKAEGETDLTQSRADYNAADKLLWQEVHSITLNQRPQIDGVANGLANLGSFGFATIDYTKIGWMKGATNPDAKS